jgi:hypothetical protein
LVPLNEYGRQPVRYLIGSRAPNIRVADASAITAEPMWIVLPTDNARPRFEGRVYAHDPTSFVLVRGDTVYVLPPLKEESAASLESTLAALPAQAIRNEIGMTDARAYRLDVSKVMSFESPAVKPRSVPFSSAVTLVDYALNAQRVEPGGTVPLTLWWRSTHKLSDDNMIFVHLLDMNQEVASAGDVIPALGVYPTFLWKPGEIVPTHHQLRVPLRTLPGKYTVEIGMYNVLNGDRLDALDTQGKVVDSRVVVGSVKVAPRETITYNPQRLQHANFGDQIALIGYDLQNGNAPREFRIALYWQTLAEMDHDYTVFVHILDADGNIVAQADHQPHGGSYPTSIWDKSETVRDDFALTAPEGAKGNFKIRIGWYDLKTGERLPVRGANNQSDDNVVLDSALGVP